MHDPWHKMVPPGAGFFGAILMMTFLGEMSKREWFVALATGVMVPYFGTETLMHYLDHTFEWVAQPAGDHSMGLAGLIGFVMGLMSIHLVGALATFGKRFASNPRLPGVEK